MRSTPWSAISGPGRCEDFRISYATATKLLAFGIVEMMDTGKADMVDSISRAAGPQGDPGPVAVPEASESAFQVIFLPPLKVEDAQAEGCNV